MADQIALEDLRPAAGRVGEPSTRHLIITRLNLPMGARWSERAWIEERLAVCQAQTAPAVWRQTNQDFDWWWVACRTTPEVDQMVVDAATSAGSQLEWADPQVGEPLRSAVARIVGASPGRVLVTRLDSDDVLHERFVEKVQARARRCEGPFELINPLVGVMWCDGYVAIWPYVASNFLTSVTDWDGVGTARTAYDFSHDQAYREAPVLQMAGTPLWLVISHGANRSSNQLRGVHVPSRLVRRWFAFEGLERKPWSPRLFVRTAGAMAGAIVLRPGSRERLARLVRGSMRRIWRGR